MFKHFRRLFMAILALALSWKSTMYCDGNTNCVALFADVGFDYHWLTYAAFLLVCVDLVVLYFALRKAAQ